MWKRLILYLKRKYHCHEWEIINEIDIYDCDTEERTETTLPIGERYVCKCKICGELKHCKFT